MLNSRWGVSILLPTPTKWSKIQKWSHVEKTLKSEKSEFTEYTSQMLSGQLVRSFISTVAYVALYSYITILGQALQDQTETMQHADLTMLPTLDIPIYPQQVSGHEIVRQSRNEGLNTFKLMLKSLQAICYAKSVFVYLLHYRIRLIDGRFIKYPTRNVFILLYHTLWNVFSAKIRPFLTNWREISTMLG